MTTTTDARARLMTVLLATSLGAAVPGASRAAEPAAPAFDAKAAWTRFLAEADVEKATKAYDVLGELSYDLQSVDAGACAAHRDELVRAVATTPVSIALRHASVLCAQATKDEATAATQNAALDALASLALSQGSTPEPDIAPPIRVAAARDAQALLAVAGLEASYDYYVLAQPARYMPYVKVVIDPDTGHERHLAFDVVDTLNAINRKDPNSGYPIQRTQIADLIVDEEAGAGLVRALDLRAVRASVNEALPKGKIAQLRDAANAGGVQSSIAWMATCMNAPSEDCTGLIDALLAGSEKRQGVPMALLALAYAEGVGVAKDEAAARTLLDAADARWTPAAASAALAGLWPILSADEMPAFLRERAQRSVAAGNLQAFFLDVQARVERKTPLDAAARTRLESGEANLRGAGYAYLARDALARDATAEAVDWLRRAATAGSGWAEAQYGWRLRFGRDVTEDDAAAHGWLRAAAQDGEAFAARLLAAEAVGANDWNAAANWLLAPAKTGDVQSLLDLSRLLASGRLGQDKVQSGVSSLESLANGGVSDARRQLASMAMLGEGMEKSPAKAEAWLLADAESGNHEAEAMLGSLYLQGSLGKTDEVAGKRWLDRAMAAGEPSGYTEYGSWLYQRKTPDGRKQAIAIWESGLKLDSELIANNYAWTLCTTPYDDVRDAKHGLEVSARMGDPDALSAGRLDTVAACAAAAGDYATAVRMQKRVVTLFGDLFGVDDEAVDASLKGARERLALYEAGKPYRESER